MTNELTQTVGRIEFKPDIAKPGDLVIYEQPFGISRRTRRYYGLVTRIERETLWIISAYTEDSNGVTPFGFGIPADGADRIVEILPNGIKIEKRRR